LHFGSHPHHKHLQHAVVLSLVKYAYFLHLKTKKLSILAQYALLMGWGSDVSVSFELYAKWDALQTWSRLIDFGDGANADNVLISNTVS